VRSVHVRFGGDDDDDDEAADDDDETASASAATPMLLVIIDLPRRSPPTFSQYIYTLGTKDVNNLQCARVLIGLCGVLLSFWCFLTLTVHQGESSLPPPSLIQMPVYPLPLSHHASMTCAGSEMQTTMP
jgi:hypothetical protein